MVSMRAPAYPSRAKTSSAASRIASRATSASRSRIALPTFFLAPPPVLTDWFTELIKLSTELIRWLDNSTECMGCQGEASHVTLDLERVYDSDRGGTSQIYLQGNGEFFLCQTLLIRHLAIGLPLVSGRWE